MNPPPVPFGDPTRVQAENKAAVGKGIAFGCGGCALLVSVFIAFIACIVAVVMMAMRSTDACGMSLLAAQKSEIMKRELGEPMTLGWIIMGSVNINNGHGRANLNVPISGPKGDATIHTEGTKQQGAPWVFTEMQATIKATGQKVDLLKP